MGYAIGIDIGGTFTDFAIADSTGDQTLIKVPTTRAVPEDAVFDGLGQYAALRGFDVAGLLDRTDLFVHGTTIATNAVIERSGPVVGLITTAGHRDILALRDGFKPDRYNLRIDPPDPFVPRRLRQVVTERIVYDGSIAVPLASDDVVRALDRLVRFGAESIAVCLLWSVRNPVHELQIRDLIRERLPELPVTLSHEVRPSLGEWPRTSATVLSAYIRPTISRYLRSLERRLSDNGYKRPLLIMQSNGGTSTLAEIERRPITAVASGPAAGPAAAVQVASEFSESNVITIDMGGTSFDVSMVTEGSAAISSEIQVDEQPIGVPALEVHSIGAGGGSIAFVDSGGALRVGPRSAGSIPGPASYQRGGTEATVSDANVVLGFLDESNPLGGTLRLSNTLAEEAIERNVGSPLGLSLVEAAWAIFSIVNNNMVEAIKALSVQRGIDPRKYALVVGGGAGPVHGTSLARILGIPRIFIPREAGVLCAFGMACANVRHDYVRAHPQRRESLDYAAVRQIYAEMETEARRDLEAEGFVGTRVKIERSVDMLYRNQVKELTVPLALGQIEPPTIDELCDRFHRLHEARYTYAIPEAAIDFYHWRLTAYGLLDHDQHADRIVHAADDSSHALRGTREVHFDVRSPMEVVVYDGDLLKHGMEVTGPAIIERTSTTIVIFPGERLIASAHGTFAVDVIS